MYAGSFGEVEIVSSQHGAQVIKGSIFMRSSINFTLLTCLVVMSWGKDKAYNLMVGQLLRFHRNQSRTYHSETLLCCAGNSIEVNIKKSNMSSLWVIMRPHDILDWLTLHSPVSGSQYSSRECPLQSHLMQSPKCGSPRDR